MSVLLIFHTHLQDKDHENVDAKMVITAHHKHLILMAYFNMTAWSDV